MKRFVGLVVMLMVPAMISLAGSPYKQGDIVGQLGIGIGGLGGFYGSSSLPVISAGVDVGISRNISVGGVAGYTVSTHDNSIVVLATPRTYKWKYTYLTIAGRGSYHFLDLLEGNNRIDLYTGLSLGYNVVSAKYDGDPALRATAVSASSSYLFWAVHAGGKYYFSQSFAAFAELGYGLGFLNVGIAMKF